MALVKTIAGCIGYGGAYHAAGGEPFEMDDATAADCVARKLIEVVTDEDLDALTTPVIEIPAEVVAPMTTEIAASPFETKKKGKR